VLEYLRWVEGQRPDVETVNLFFVQRGEEAELARRHLRQGRAVFTSAPSTLMADDLAFVPDAGCGCSRVLPRPDIP
jgi:hypothetical protein